MLNHSCAPNTVNMVVGSSMMVRANEQLSKGSEITTSYLGELAAAPVSARQQALKGAYGFSCGCRRCQVCQGNMLCRHATFEASISTAPVINCCQHMSMCTMHWLGHCHHMASGVVSPSQLMVGPCHHMASCLASPHFPSMHSSSLSTAML